MHHDILTTLNLWSLGASAGEEVQLTRNGQLTPVAQHLLANYIPNAAEYIPQFLEDIKSYVGKKPTGWRIVERRGDYYFITTGT